MYIPQKFKVEDRKKIFDFIRQYPFGLLLTVTDGEIHDTHTPFILSENDDCLYGHVARVNPQWNSWGEGAQPRAKVIFTGPHAYVSPTYYESEFNVPTWNYTAVSIAGRLTVIEDKEEVLEFLDQLVRENEGTEDGWKLDRTDERYMNLLGGIVVFKISMYSVEASFKMNQNKTIEDQQGVIHSLQKSGCPFEHEVADMMENLKK